MTKINALVYSYKNKNIYNVVNDLIENTDNDISVLLIDQNSIERSEAFLNNDKVTYEHIPWDRQYGIGFAYSTFFNLATADHLLIISDDASVKPGWDSKLLDLVDSGIMVSGNAKVTLDKQDAFSFKKTYSLVNDIQETSWIDKTFMFFHKDLLTKSSFPTMFKYYGFEEFATMEFIKNSIKIYSATKDIYEDNEQRNLEKLYVPYSLEHKYNLMIDRLQSGLPEAAEFKSIHGIDDISLARLPYQTDDVEYMYYGKFNIDDLSDNSKKYNTIINKIGLK